jgi:hypothetical protein
MEDTMRVMKWIYLSLALGLPIFSGACGGGDGGTSPGGGPSGSYALVGVNEDGLPEDEPMNWGTASFRGGSLQLFADGTWEMAIQYVDVEENYSDTVQDYGDYDRDGEDLWFVSEAYGDEFEGTLDGDEVWVTYDFDGDGEYESDFVFVE